jgi:hypothetical protein
MERAKPSVEAEISTVSVPIVDIYFLVSIANRAKPSIAFSSIDFSSFGTNGIKSLGVNASAPLRRLAFAKSEQIIPEL